MLNEKSCEKLQKISDAYVALVKKELGVDMVCLWGGVDSESELVGAGFSMTDRMKDDDLKEIYFTLNNNFFNKIFQYEE